MYTYVVVTNGLTTYIFPYPPAPRRAIIASRCGWYHLLQRGSISPAHTIWYTPEERPTFNMENDEARWKIIFHAKSTRVDHRRSPDPVPFGQLFFVEVTDFSILCLQNTLHAVATIHISTKGNLRVKAATQVPHNSVHLHVRWRPI